MIFRLLSIILIAGQVFSMDRDEVSCALQERRILFEQARAEAIAGLTILNETSTSEVSCPKLLESFKKSPSITKKMLDQLRDSIDPYMHYSIKEPDLLCRLSRGKADKLQWDCFRAGKPGFYGLPGKEVKVEFGAQSVHVTRQDGFEYSIPSSSLKLRP